MNVCDKLNEILEKQEIPLFIFNENSLTDEFDDDCRFTYHDDLIIYKLKNLINNDIIGFIALQISSSEKCVYINYRCVKSEYRGMSFGIFLAFIGIYFTIDNGFDAIFSVGESVEDVDADYERSMRGKKWSLSQGLLIKKFGFYDNYKEDGYNEDKLRNNMDYCGDFAETILYVKTQGNLSKYNEYLNKFKTLSRILFKKYLEKYNYHKTAFFKKKTKNKNKK